MVNVPSELVTRATAELDEKVRKELEIADPATHIAIAILNNEQEQEKDDGKDE